MKELIALLDQIKTNTLQNYVIAGLNSSLIESGKVRYFECSRDHQDSITPHSHRFDFVCLVLEGTVVNKLWVEDIQGDLFQLSTLTYSGEVGHHQVTRERKVPMRCNKKTYSQGDFYSMKAHEIHSIEFSKGAKVLFFEGPTLCLDSDILEPVVNGEVIPTYEQKPYMFRKEQSK